MTRYRRKKRDNYLDRHQQRRLDSALSRAKALWPQAAPVNLAGLDWISAACGQSQRPLYTLNRYCLAHGVNPLCFCRVSILRFATAGRTPHNLGPPAATSEAINDERRTAPAG